MAWKKLEKKETPLFWWVWKDKVGQPLEGYWVGVFDHEAKDPKDPNHTQKVKVLVVYDSTNDVYYRAFLPKRYDLSELKAGWRVRITALQDKETQKLDWEVEYNDKDVETVEVPDEYYNPEI
mgnify:CR=1 FL=1